ncbi:MAG: hypothetical protein ABIK25_07340 [Pseudomonadota bacterium]
MFANEVLHARPKGKTYYYEVMSVFTESHTASGSRLLIELIPLHHITPNKGQPIVAKCKKLTQGLTFDLSLDHLLKSARFATKRDVLLPDDFRSSGLGTYAFSKLIEWGQKYAPDYIFQKLSLSDVDAKTDEDKKRRNDFYSNLQFKLDFSQDLIQQKTGSCKAAPLSTLKARQVNSNKIVKIVGLDDLYSEMSERNEEQAIELEKSTKAVSRLEKQRDKLLATRKTLRWLCFGLGVTVLLLLYALFAR